MGTTTTARREMQPHPSATRTVHRWLSLVSMRSTGTCPPLQPMTPCSPTRRVQPLAQGPSLSSQTAALRSASPAYRAPRKTRSATTVDYVTGFRGDVSVQRALQAATVWAEAVTSVTAGTYLKVLTTRTPGISRGNTCFFYCGKTGGPTEQIRKLAKLGEPKA